MFIIVKAGNQVNGVHCKLLSLLVYMFEFSLVKNNNVMRWGGGDNILFLKMSILSLSPLYSPE